MSKRMIDTEVWSDPFFRSLDNTYKLLWIFLFTNCDHAGIWRVDWDLAKLRIPSLGSIDEAIEVFGDRILPIKNGEKWFITSFIPFQYGILRVSHRVHQSVLKVLENNEIKYDGERVIKPLRNPYVRDKDKDKDKDKEKERAEIKIEKKEAEKKPVLFRKSEYFEFEKFRAALDDWEESKCRTYWQQALDWSDGVTAKGGKEQKKIDWIRTVRVWARNDVTNGGHHGTNGTNGKSGGAGRRVGGTTIAGLPVNDVDRIVKF